jgi:hypothetical protein
MQDRQVVGLVLVRAGARHCGATQQDQGGEAGKKACGRVHGAGVVIGFDLAKFDYVRSTPRTQYAAPICTTGDNGGHFRFLTDSLS